MSSNALTNAIATFCINFAEQFAARFMISEDLQRDPVVALEKIHDAVSTEANIEISDGDCEYHIKRFGLPEHKKTMTAEELKVDLYIQCKEFIDQLRSQIIADFKDAIKLELRTEMLMEIESRCSNMPVTAVPTGTEFEFKMPDDVANNIMANDRVFAREYVTSDIISVDYGNTATQTYNKLCNV